MILRVLAMAVALWLGAPAPAHACTTCWPTVIFPLGPVDAPPANGLFSSSDDYDPNLVTITIDGEPAQLVDAGITWTGHHLAWRLEPTPTVGASIEIGQYPEPEVCFGDEAPGPILYIAGPPDLEAPTGPTAHAYDVHAYDFLDTKGCGGDSLAYWLHGEGYEGAPTFLRVEVIVAGDVVEIQHHAPEPGAFDLRVPIADAAILEPTDACLRIRTMDAAGNASDAIELCSPCHVRNERDVAEPYQSTPPEPSWTDADLHPGGSCAMVEDGTSSSESGTEPEPEPEPEPDTTSTGREPESTGAPETTVPADSGVIDRGCACNTAPPPAALAWALALLALRRRRTA